MVPRGCLKLPIISNSNRIHKCGLVSVYHRDIPEPQVSQTIFAVTWGEGRGVETTRLNCITSFTVSLKDREV